MGIAIGGSVLNEVYQRNMVIPAELVESLGTVPLESFPAAIEIGAELFNNGDLIGLELIENAKFAFMEGMLATASVMAIIALINAILVKLYMPSRIINEK